MRHVALGSAYRAVRVELRLRQADVAARAHLSQQTVSRIERGDVGGVTVDVLDALAAALEANARYSLNWRGSALPRLLDRRHARLQEVVVAMLVAAGWEVRVEETFNYFGERGSVDVLAWRADVAALLIVEIKSELVDLQDTVASLDRKLRVVPRIVPGAHGWEPRCVAAVLVLPDATVHRNVVASHAALLGAAFGARNVAIRRWLESPSGSLRGIWFVRNTPGASGVRVPPASRRVYRSRKGATARKRVAERARAADLVPADPPKRGDRRA